MSDGWMSSILQDEWVNNRLKFWSVGKVCARKYNMHMQDFLHITLHFHGYLQPSVTIIMIMRLFHSIAEHRPLPIISSHFLLLDLLLSLTMSYFLTCPDHYHCLILSAFIMLLTSVCTFIHFQFFLSIFLISGTDLSTLLYFNFF